MKFEPQMMAYCGIYCRQCSVATAHETQERAHLLPMPSRYDHLKQAELSECACNGCKGENSCGECALKDCAEAKGFVSCADCEAFPCAKLLGFAKDGVPHHGWALENLYAIRGLGYTDWFADFAQKLFCGCGERLSWYYKCPKHS